MPLFKDGSGLMEQGLDLVRRGDFVAAGAKFVSAAQKFQREANHQGVAIATAYAGVMSLFGRTNDANAIIAASAALRSQPSDFDLQLGSRATSASQLARELDLSAREINLGQAVVARSGDSAGLAQALQRLAGDFRQIGTNPMAIPELFEHRSVDPSSKFNPLMAVSFEILGESLAASDPLAAAEQYRTAQQYWNQASEAGRAQACASRVGELALRAKCWFCGREGVGHGIQFVLMPIDQDVTGLKGLADASLPSLDKAGRGVYVCKGCNSAVRLLASRIAQLHVADLETRIRAELDALERRLRMTVSGVSR